MSSYLSNLLTTTTSRYNSLRRTLLSDESDGDTEDDSHISRILRAYYTEKSRPFPPWLPPDPNAPPPTPVQYATIHNLSNSRVGTPSRGLGDLWGDQPQQQPRREENLSLRTRGGGRRGGPLGPRSDHSYNPDQTASRPLPSQRAGSYQSTLSQQSTFRTNAPSPPPSAGSGSASGTSAQERLKARLWGGRSNSPTPSASSQSTVGHYDRNPSYSGSMSSTRSESPMDGRRPYIAATSPWISGDEPRGGRQGSGDSYTRRRPVGGR